MSVPVVRATRAFAERRDWGRKIGIRIIGSERAFDDSPRPQEMLASLVWRAVDENEVYEPTTDLSVAAAQTLMDSLWLAGIRPSDSQHTSEVLAAQSKHLEDMRMLAIGSLRKKGAIE